MSHISTKNRHIGPPSKRWRPDSPQHVSHRIGRPCCYDDPCRCRHVIATADRRIGGGS